MPQWSTRKASAEYGHLYKLKAYIEGRKRFLRDNPWCVWCERRGIKTPATVVNHIIPHKGDKKLFLDRKNWEPVCTRCHNSACKQQDNGNPVRGCDVDGNPIDPASHWWEQR